MIFNRLQVVIRRKNNFINWNETICLLVWMSTCWSALSNHRISISNTSEKSEGLRLTNDLWDFQEFFCSQESFVSPWFGFQNSPNNGLTNMTSACRNNTKSPEIISVFLSLRQHQLQEAYILESHALEQWYFSIITVAFQYSNEIKNLEI